MGEQQNRVLVGLKQDGSCWPAKPRSWVRSPPLPIADLYLLEQPLTPEEMQSIGGAGSRGQASLFWRRATAVPALSQSAAARPWRGADIILYGPGTQHSSLFPSYRIARGRAGGRARAGQGAGDEPGQRQ